MRELALPIGWSTAKLDDVIGLTGIVSDGDWVESKDQDPNGNIRLIQLADIGDGYFINKSNRFMNEDAADRLNCMFLKEGDVVIARMPDPLGRACIFPKMDNKSVTVVDICLIRFDSNSAFVPKIFMHWINSPLIRNEIQLQATGTTRKRITRKKLAAFDFPVPPLDEQTRIANKLDELLAQVNTIKARVDAIPAVLKCFRQSVLSAAVSGRLTEDWRNSQNEYISKKKLIEGVLISRKEKWEEEQIKSFDRKGKSLQNDNWKSKYKEPTGERLDEYDTTLIKGIPNEWASSNLDTVSVLVTGKTPSTTDEDNWNGETPFLSPSQISPDGKIIPPTRYVSEIGKSKSPILPKDAVLVVCIGTIGKVGFLDKESAFNQQINAMIAVDYMDSRFLFYWAKTLHAWLNKTSSAVVNAAIINKSRLSTAPCPVPSRDEQLLIVEHIEQLLAFADQIELRVKDAQSRINNLAQSILAKSFRGELVPQDPNDEPASELLARIMKERSEAIALTRAAKKATRKKAKI